MTLTLKGLKNHNFTITTNTSQHVEFFHSLIFIVFLLTSLYYEFLDRKKVKVESNKRLDDKAERNNCFPKFWSGVPITCQSSCTGDLVRFLWEALSF